MPAIVFKVIYWLGMITEILIRAPFQKTWQAGTKNEQRVSTTERVLLGLLTFGGFVLPLVYSLTHWLDFANYRLPDWAGPLGTFLLACALLIFARAHMDLKSNWSPSLETYEGHALIMRGLYRYIRHPMYASQWVWSIAQILLLQNWLAGPVALIVFIPFYVMRVRAEENMMLDTFGIAYKEYMRKTGGVIPRF